MLIIDLNSPSMWQQWSTLSARSPTTTLGTSTQCGELGPLHWPGPIWTSWPYLLNILSYPLPMLTTFLISGPSLSPTSKSLLHSRIMMWCMQLSTPPFLGMTPGSAWWPKYLIPRLLCPGCGQLMRSGIATQMLSYWQCSVPAYKGWFDLCPYFISTWMSREHTDGIMYCLETSLGGKVWVGISHDSMLQYVLTGCVY